MARKSGSKTKGRDRSRRYHDRIANQYDRMYEASAYWKLYDEITWNNIKRNLPSNSGANVLDAGGGTGKWGMRLAKTGFRVLVVDTSLRMLDRARKNAAQAGLLDRVQVAAGDISRLGFLPENHFELALAQGDPLSICDHPRKAVASVFSLLKPGGVFIASVDSRWAAMWYHFEKEGPGERFLEVLRSGLTEWQTERSAERFRLKTFSVDELSRLFADAGFEVLSVIGKTILPLRAKQGMLEDPAAYRRILDVESRLNKVPELLGLASHLEISGRKPR